MSLAAPSDERQEQPADIRKILRRRQSAENVYWVLARPRPRVYGAAAARIALRRLAVAVIASAAIIAAAFLGVVAGNIGTPAWPPLKAITWLVIWRAEAPAAPEVASLVPACLVLGAILACVPTPRRWLFRLSEFSGAALGYDRRLVPAPSSRLELDVIGKAASLAVHLRLSHLPTPAAIAVMPLAGSLIAVFLLNGDAYRTAVLTRLLLPRRSVSHAYSLFRVVSPARRIAAVPIAAALLSSTAWIAENIRAALPGRTYESLFLAHDRVSITAWAAISLGLALAICVPRPQGIPALLLLPLAAVTAYAFAPQVDLVGIPSWMPGPPDGFWFLLPLYFLVVGFGSELVAGLLDWPGF